MALPLYLARTGAEMGENPPDAGSAYLACHFSPGGSGLSCLPDFPGPGSILILDDSTPMDGHDPELILRQLSAFLELFPWECLLLDFQRPGLSAQGRLAALLADALPCPVGVSEGYAAGLPCPVFLPPVPPDMALTDYLSPWKGREIWLEAALDGVLLTLTPSGCTPASLFAFPETGLRDGKLHCHYSMEINHDSALFRLWRTREDLDTLLRDAESLGVAKALGLWQELGTPSADVLPAT